MHRRRGEFAARSGQAHWGLALVFALVGLVSLSAAARAQSAPQAVSPKQAVSPPQVKNLPRVHLGSRGLDARVDRAVRPLSDTLSKLVFFKVQIAGAAVPLVVLFLVLGAAYFTWTFRFINVRGFGHALAIASGKYADPAHPGEVTHFQALTAALSGTIGIGNIGGVAVAIAVGGPGVTLWMIVAGLLGMSTKFAECILAVSYRRENPDGSMSGGPMYYLKRGLGERGYVRLGRALGAFYAAGIVVGCLGIGNMFQSNQAYAQLVAVTGGAQQSWLADKGWLVGLVLAVLVGLVIVGGIRGIARVTSRLVPFMAVLYIGLALAVLALNIDAVPAAVGTIVSEAFSPRAVGGGFLGVMMVGFQRAVFSNEAGIGSAAIAHSAVKTSEPSTEGLVAMLGPFIDTVLICSLTALVIVTTQQAAPGHLAATGTEGVAMTTAAIERSIPYSGYAVALAAVLFAFSSAVSWSYYGLKGWTYLVGERPGHGFKLVFCVFVALGAAIKLDSVLNFSDALVFLICVPNIFGLIVLTPVARAEISGYWSRLAARAASR